MSAGKLQPSYEVIEDGGKFYSVMRQGTAEVRCELPEDIGNWSNEEQEAYFDQIIPEQQASLARQIAVIAEIQAENTAAAGRIAKAEEKRAKRATKRRNTAGLKVVEGGKK